MQAIRVHIPSQTLRLERDGVPLRSWPISSSLFGTGAEEGSFRTPTGRFAIAEMIGGDAAIGAVFRSRLPTGELGDPASPEDQVLTRILWLEGLDPENANTRSRYIYIHGTNQEGLIGTPASHGCIRMRNADVAELFDAVEVGTPVWIEG